MNMRSTFFAMFLSMVFAAVGQNSSEISITEKINREGNIIIYHSEAIESRIKPEIVPDSLSTSTDTTAEGSELRGKAQKVRGYRVLVFTDNNVASARNEANSVAKTVAAAFPDSPVYVGYNSPNWRVKVGDFRTKEEALALLAKIKKTLPEIGREARVIHEKINLSE